MQQLREENKESLFSALREIFGMLKKICLLMGYER
jgi:hypothetical protein